MPGVSFSVSLFPQPGTVSGTVVWKSAFKAVLICSECVTSEKSVLSAPEVLVVWRDSIIIQLTCFLNKWNHGLSGEIFIKSLYSYRNTIMHLLSAIFLGSVNLAALLTLSTPSSLILPHNNMVVQDFEQKFCRGLTHVILEVKQKSCCAIWFWSGGFAVKATPFCVCAVVEGVSWYLLSCSADTALWSGQCLVLCSGTVQLCSVLALLTPAFATLFPRLWLHF